MKRLLLFASLGFCIAFSAAEVSFDVTYLENDLRYEKFSGTLFTGVAVMYHANGNLWWRTEYTDGRRNGLWEQYWDNGSISFRGSYIEGKPHGSSVYYDKNGYMVDRTNYKDGEKHGLTESYGPLFFRERSTPHLTCYEKGEEVDLSHCGR
jgi:hypothetical protein